MKQEDYNDMMRTPEEAWAERHKPPRKLPNCPYCGEEYSGDGVMPCVECEYNVEISNNDKLDEEINLVLSDEETKLSDGAYRALTFVKDSLYILNEDTNEIEPVAWMSPNKERLEFSRKDTVYGSNTIPLYTKQYTRPYTGERIVCAALKDHGDNIYHGYHHEQIYFDCDLEGKDGVVEGFVTSKNGRFVDREEAWLVAEKANQIIHRNIGVLGSLFCENLY